VSSENTERRHGPTPALLLAALIVLAFALRFWRLGDWNFEATEIFTLRDSTRAQFGNARPLIYLLNYYLVRPLFPLDEFGLRLLPAIFGVLAIPAFYFVARRLIGTRAALFGALLLTVSPLHVFYSQFARYWSLVFLLSAVFPYAIYLAICERDRRALALGLVTGVLAALAHPVSVLLVAGLGMWFLVTSSRRSYLTQLWGQRSVRWGVLLAVILAGVIALRFIPVLGGWISMHDKTPGTGQFLLRSPNQQGLKQIVYLAAYLESLTLPVVLIGLVGIRLLWQGRDRPLALLLTCLAAFPVVFLTLLSLRTPVSTYYLVPAAPVFFIGAGIFLDRLFEVDFGLRPRWLLPATVTVMVIAAGGPTLVSQYRDGRRYDFRGVAHWLEARVAPTDVVFSDQHMVLAHYLPGTQVQRLREAAPLAQTLRALDQSGGGGALWIVSPTPSHALRTNPNVGGLYRWIYDNCQLRNTIGVGRLDFRQNYLQIFRCPLALPRRSGATSE
jgi:mannosyltransferase